MQLIRVLNKQSFLDLSLLATGSTDNAFFIARANERTPSDTIEAGEEIVIPLDAPNSKEIIEYYSTNNIEPATALTQTDIDLVKGCEGISCWAIELDFKVS